MFKPGVSGNPKGREKGSKNKFSEVREGWLKAYYAGGGYKLWLKLQKEDLALYLKIGASMLPKEVDAEVHGLLEVSWIGEDNNSV